MKIAIIGAGSLGMLFASYLSDFFTITLYTRTDLQAQEINKVGIILQKDRQQTKFKVNALPITMWRGTEVLTIIAVKQYQLESILEKITDLQVTPNNLLFLQNGMGHLRLLENIRANAIFLGSVEHGAQKENAFTVSHNGAGAINVAVFKGESAVLRQFATAVPPEFPITIREDYYEMLINKLIANAVINPLTAILKVKNGQLVSNLFYLAAVKNLLTEISDILSIDEPDEQLKNIINICKKTANNQSSMLKDIEANRETEVEAILGYLLAEAKRLGKKSPQVESYYYLLKGKEMVWGECK